VIDMEPGPTDMICDLVNNETTLTFLPLKVMNKKMRMTMTLRTNVFSSQSIQRAGECVMRQSPPTGHLWPSQMSMKKGTKVFGNDRVDAVRSELQQLHDRAVMRPRRTSDISRAQKRAALAYLMFLKRKRCPFSRKNG
jgi:hypothetical protein